MEQLALFPDMVAPKIGIFGMNNIGIEVLTRFEDSGYRVYAHDETDEMKETIAKQCDFIFINVSTKSSLEQLCNILDDITDIKEAKKLPSKIFLIKGPLPEGTMRMLSIVYDQDTILVYDDNFLNTGKLGSSNIDSFAILQKHLNSVLNIDVNFVDYKLFEYK